jgi:nitrite reductase/ring-hydroxylating ferredoxin subunit
LVDLAVLCDDYLAVQEERIREIEALLTVVGGEPVHAAGPFAGMAQPDWPAEKVTASCSHVRASRTRRIVHVLEDGACPEEEALRVAAHWWSIELIDGHAPPHPVACGA